MRNSKPRFKHDRCAGEHHARPFTPSQTTCTGTETMMAVNKPLEGEREVCDRRDDRSDHDPWGAPVAGPRALTRGDGLTRGLNFVA